MWHAVSPPGDIPEGAGREFTVDGRIVALFHVGDEFHAIDGMCAHSGGPLGTGMLRGCIVTCPWHGWQFDVSTGQHCLTPHIQQQKYDCKVEEGQVWIDLPEA